ncbi:MAG: hypothetical protein GY751_03005 [Bacteroidetes bacterium]|nr:hypothetical protein [Bacteroidota bacterium]
MISSNRYFCSINCQLFFKQIVSGILLLSFYAFPATPLLGQNTAEQADTIEIDSTSKTFGTRIARFMTFAPDKNWVYLPLPAISYSPETSLSLGISNQIFYRSRTDTTTTTSNVEVNAYYTLEKQYKFEVEWGGFFKNDDLIVEGQAEYGFSPLLFYGTGSNAPLDPLAVYSAKRLILQFLANFRLNDVLWMGPALDINTFLNGEFSDVDTLSDFEEDAYRNVDKIHNTGAGYQLIFDSREHKLYTRHGTYFRMGNVVYPRFLGSTTNRYALSLDYRQFVNPGNGLHAIGWQAMIQSQFGEIPFQKLSTFGGKYRMRGYYEGRFRDRHAAFFQSEYRFPIWAKGHLYGTAFIGVGEVFSNPGEIVVKDMKASVGSGIRIMLDNDSRTTIRFDYARNREGENGYYLSIMEAF